MLQKLSKQRIAKRTGAYQKMKELLKIECENCKYHTKTNLGVIDQDCPECGQYAWQEFWKDNKEDSF